MNEDTEIIRILLSVDGIDVHKTIYRIDLYDYFLYHQPVTASKFPQVIELLKSK